MRQNTLLLHPRIHVCGRAFARREQVRINTPAGLVSVAEHPLFWAGFALFGEPN